jgi:hypothetical protein
MRPHLTVEQRQLALRLKARGLVAALLLRPEIFRFKATLTKWVSLDLEMRSKANPGQPSSSLPDEH